MSAPTAESPASKEGLSFAPLRFADLPAWGRADHRPALFAFRRSAPAIVGSAAPPSPSGLSPSDFAVAARAALGDAGEPTAHEARAFFERFFRPAAILEGGTPAPGFVTGYYEPELPASRTPTARFRVPLYGRPDDLVSVEEGESVEGLEGGARFAMAGPAGRPVAYPDRAAIEAGHLAGRGLEIAYLESPVDAFFVHVQGSARLRLPDGETMRVGYAAKNGHRFTAIGRVLVRGGELPLEGADMDGIRRWLAAHPDRTQALLRQNRSFIFFREVAVEPGAGPIGGAGVPLTPLGSLAVDASLHAYGMPVFVDAPNLVIAGAPFGRLLIAQDTGSAILGSARGDIFVGSGEEAGRIAGAIRHEARFLALLPKDVRR